MLRSIGGYDYPPHENANPVSDYRLITDAKKPVRVFSLSCGKDLWQGDLGVSYPELGKLAIRGAWMAFTSDDRLYLRWRDETVLLLNKITKDAPEKASFDCAKASNNTEREICSSRELSGFDRSISDAYMRLLNQTQDAGENEKIIADDQHKWIKKRNTCNSDKKCILSLMKFRLQFLVDQSRT
ncbi:lysozyme inhibitor LprI family protein [Paraburkholderia phytofirmans]|uniref:lysozyme inhibitor LprI family protein n=1 Tax=Paraburkholderia phytofirmans TaxID=261302 RepID=UPI0011E01F43|nr:hypothetical protein [Paraburkholderia phytofirmans]